MISFVLLKFQRLRNASMTRYGRRSHCFVSIINLVSTIDVLLIIQLSLSDPNKCTQRIEGNQLSRRNFS